ncbi:MAG: tRNA (guanosine(46)-N7)-methyltransferase TrmB [Pseudomonadota bacterium]|nr:tRNA (guanosine(46)-N7)-methyltransferase TrmB [Pseudomonadota bacterium]
MGNSPIVPTQFPNPKVLYGRRHGRGLRRGQQQLIASLLPELQIILRAGKQVVPADYFDEPIEKIWLEIGFGAGEHLIWQAAANPKIGLIGCEPYLNGIAKLLRQVREKAITNIKLFSEDARLLIERLPESSIDKVFILFPDPWPKARHHKRRIISVGVVDQLARVLRDGAELRIATDEPGYLEWILWHFNNHCEFSWDIEKPADCRHNPADWPPTRYQNKAIGAGRNCVFLSYKRLDRAIFIPR